jgi:hypothetical protein
LESAGWVPFSAPRLVTAVQFSSNIEGQRPVATELIRIALDVLLLRTEAKIIPDEQSCDVRLRSRTGYARDVSIGWIGDAVDTAESLSTGDLRIEHKYGVCSSRTLKNKVLVSETSCSG